MLDARWKKIARALKVHALSALLLFPLASMCLALANPVYRASSDGLVFLAFALGLVTAFFSVLLGISYVVLVFQAGRAVDDVIYE